MDSLSQLALGSAVGIAVMGRRTAVWKAALWGGIAGTSPDLDALIDFGDAVKNMTYHRAESHGLFYLTLISPPIAWIVSRIHGEREHFKRWWLAMWLALFTHPLLDWFTIYGTQLWQPFSERPLGLGSMFIIDPLYTLPLLIGVVIALSLRSNTGLRWNTLGLALSCGYLAWSALAQQHVLNVARESLRQQNIAVDRMFATPTPLNTVLWRVVAMQKDGYVEGFYSLLDTSKTVHFDRFPHDTALFETTKTLWSVDRMARFTHGFFRVKMRDSRVTLADLRMGQEPNYVFEFVVAEKSGERLAEVRPTLAVGSRGDPQRAFPWLWARLKGNQLPPPR
jgi:inner membrane protein